MTRNLKFLAFVALFSLISLSIVLAALFVLYKWEGRRSPA